MQVLIITTILFILTYMYTYTICLAQQRGYYGFTWNYYIIYSMCNKVL